MISQILFGIALLVTIYFAVKSSSKIRQTILLGKDKLPTDNSGKRWKKMLLVAFGQSKMKKRPLAALLHLVVYVGFLVVNIEMIEIVLDGLTGNHRMFMKPLGSVYFYLILVFEYLAVLVLLACVVFFVRRNVAKIARFHSVEMTKKPKGDANFILIFECILMSAFLIMNANDLKFQLSAGLNGMHSSFISAHISYLFQDFGMNTMVIIERIAWWIHILGVFFFLNYLAVSKHLHIILAFPQVFYSKLTARTKMRNMPMVQTEVYNMMGLPVPEELAAMPVDAEGAIGAKDVTDLSKLDILSAFSCTECGRCTSVCPANTTGKKLSPRKIMMDVRTRAAEKFKDIKTKVNSDLSLHSHISSEELWACTTCNSCFEACPLEINPVGIITEMRRYLVMEESQAPQPLNNMMGNIENNGAPWQYNQMDKLNWAKE